MSAPEPTAPERETCCCTCEEPAHKRSQYGETCARCGKHRAPRGEVRWVPEDWTPEEPAERLDLDDIEGEFYGLYDDDGYDAERMAAWADRHAPALFSRARRAEEVEG